MYANDKPIPKTFLEFDSRGNLLRETDYLIDGKPMAPKEYVYDEKGFLIHEHSISAVDGKPYLNTQYSYNEDGTNREIRQSSLQDGTVYSVWQFNNLTDDYSEFTATGKDGEFEMKMGIKRDDKCRIAEIFAFHYLGLSVMKTSVSYDENDNVITTNSFYPLGIAAEQRMYEYEFESSGNWTNRMEYAWKKNDLGESSWKLMNQQFRAIDYYE